MRIGCALIGRTFVRKLEIRRPRVTFDVRSTAHPIILPNPMLRFILPSILCLSVFATRAPAHEAAQQMLDTAKAFLAALTPEAKAKAVFPFDAEERENWHFIPRERKGLPMKEMTPEQKLLAHALLSTGLSGRGMVKASTIMSLEEVLYNIESAADESKREATREKRDPEKYYVSLFGQPSMQGTWGWRVEGHHFSLNFTIKDGQMLRATPSFFGSNPGEVRQGPRAGTRVLGQEEELGRDLAKSLNDEQWKKALVDVTAPKEMITEAKHHVSALSPLGLSDADMTPAQKETLSKLIHEHLFRIRPDIAEASWKEIQASGPVYFAWAGS